MFAAKNGILQEGVTTDKRFQNLIMKWGCRATFENT